MFEVRRAAQLVQEARHLAAAAEAGDGGARKAARERVREANTLLCQVRSRAGRLLFAEVLELGVSLDGSEDLEISIAALIGAASGFLEVRESRESRRGAARVARTLSGIYAGIGMRERAAQFALEYVNTLTEADRDLLAVAYVVCALAAAGKPEQLQEFVSRVLSHQHLEPIQSIVTILANRTGHRSSSPQELASAVRMLKYVPADLRVQCVLFAANGLLKQSEAALAVTLLTELRADLSSDPMTEARILSALGVASARAGDPDASMRHHLVAWTRYDDQRYRFGSSSVRRALDAELLRSRNGALAIAAARSDWRLLLELMESCRLQAFSDLTGAADHMDEAIATGVARKRPLRGGRTIDADALPACYQASVGDLYGARADVTGCVDVHVGGISALAQTRAGDGLTGARPRLDMERTLRRHSRSTDLWLSTWCEDRLLYWVLSENCVPFDGGVIDIVADEELSEALSIANLRYRIRPPWKVPPSLENADLTGYLEVADSAEELQATSVLARLLPPAVRKTPDPDRRLLFSCAAELAPVPWPILPLEEAATPVTRLVERFEMRFLPSLAVLDRTGRGNAAGVDASAGSEDLPFLLACDYFPAGGTDPVLARQARTHLKGDEALTTSLARFLRACAPGTDGVAFFRTHYEWSPHEPGGSGVVLADGVFPSGILAAGDQQSGRLLFGLPSTVVMSCCSTSGLRDRNGGESLGFAPLAMIAGARRLIVTSVNIEQTSFTLALDDMLIDVAVQSGDHFAGLRELQLRLLQEWRDFSLRHADRLRDLSPLPSIWAHYQAFGA